MVEEKIILTRNELQNMLNEAAHLGINKISVDSPSFNPNTLFFEAGKHLKQEVKDLQLASGHVVRERWGAMVEIRADDIHEHIRKIVLLSFFAKYNTEIPIKKREKAQELYVKFSKLFLEEFQKSCEEMK